MPEDTEKAYRALIDLKDRTIVALEKLIILQEARITALYREIPKND